MKAKFLAGIACTAMMSLSALTANAQDIKLPAPDMNRQTKTVMQTLATRHSVRDYASKQLSMQELSDLCWAACGVARDADHRTAPTARNMREIRLFVLTQDAAYEYNANANELVFKSKGDHRNLLASNDVNGGGFAQAFVNDAPVSLVMVIDFDIFGSNNDGALRMGCVDAGLVSQNINLYCEAAGLATVPRATMDVNALRRVLGLTDQQLPIMNNPVGYNK